MKNNTLLIHNNRGITLPQAIVGLTLGGIVAFFATSSIQMNSVLIQDSQKIKQMINQSLAGNNVLDDDDLLKSSLLKLSDIKDCLETPENCQLEKDKVYTLVLENSEGQVLNDNQDDNGFHERTGQPCQKGDTLCLLKRKYYFSVECQPPSCPDLHVKVFSEVAQMSDPAVAPSGPESMEKLKNLLTRYYTLKTSTPPPLIETGLITGDHRFAYLKSNGELKILGSNKRNLISEAYPESHWFAESTVVTGPGGSPLKFKSVKNHGSSHIIGVLEDGTLLATGSNAFADLIQPGTSYTVISENRPFIPHKYEVNGGNVITRELTENIFNIPWYKATPSQVYGWKPTIAPFNSPSLSKVKEVFMGSYAFNLAVRENGEAWGFGMNVNNRMGLPLGNVPAKLYYNDPSGAPKEYHYYFGGFLMNPSIPPPSASYSTPTPGNSMEQVAARFHGNWIIYHGGPNVNTSPSAGFNDPFHNTNGATRFWSNTVHEPSKSYYLGKDVGLELVEVAVGSSAACAINQFRNVVCWGANMNGSLGRGTLREDMNNNSSQNWNPGDNSKPISQYLDMGDIHDYTSYVPYDTFQSPWKTPNGEPKTTGNVTPANFFNVVLEDGVTPLSDVVKLDASFHQFCAITSERKAYCWGANPYGELARGTACNGSHNILQGLESCKDLDRALPVRSTSGILENVSNLGMRRYSTYFITENGLYVSGTHRPSSNASLGINNPNNIDLLHATPISVPGNVLSVASHKQNASCALNDLDELWCWGSNRGNGGVPVFLSPGNEFYLTPVKAASDFTE